MAENKGKNTVEEQPTAEAEEVASVEEAPAEEPVPEVKVQPKAEANEVTSVEEAPAEEKPKAEKTPKEEKEPAVSKSKTATTKTEKARKTAAIDDIMATIKNMTVLELSELVKALETEFGVTAAAPVMAAPAVGVPTATATPAEEEEEKTEFNVILKEVGANKISVIRAVRELTSLGLKESKDLVESAPKAVKEGVNKDDAAAAKQKLEEAGATADII